MGKEANPRTSRFPVYLGVPLRMRYRQWGGNSQSCAFVARPVYLSQKLGEWIPVMLLPAGGQVLRLTLGERGVVEDEFGRSALVEELKTGNRVHAPRPAQNAPGLNDELIGRELDLTANDVAAKQRECATRMRTQHRGLVHFGHGIGLHHAAQLDHLVELCFHRQRL